MKLSGLTIIIIGAAFGLCVLLFAYFQMYGPNETAAGYMTAYKVQLKEQADKQKAAEARVIKAKKLVAEAAQDWNKIVLLKTPSDNLATGGINIMENDYQLVVDSPKYRNSAQRAVNAQLHAGGVKIVSAPQLPIPSMNEKDILASYYNWPAYNFPVVLWELGQVTVTGNYDQIMKNVRAWSSMPHYLAVVDGLRLDGTSPNLTATYNLTIVGFIRAKTIYPSDPRIGGGSAGSSGSTSGFGGMGTGGGPNVGAAGMNPAGGGNPMTGNAPPAGIPGGPPPGMGMGR